MYSKLGLITVIEHKIYLFFQKSQLLKFVEFLPLDKTHILSQKRKAKT